MIPAAFAYRRPTSLAEAVRLLAAHADEAKILGHQVPREDSRHAELDRLAERLRGGGVDHATGGDPPQVLRGSTHPRASARLNPNALARDPA